MAGFVFLLVVQTLFLTNDPNRLLSANWSAINAGNVTGNATVNKMSNLTDSVLVFGHLKKARLKTKIVLNNGKTV